LSGRANRSDDGCERHRDRQRAPAAAGACVGNPGGWSVPGIFDSPPRGAAASIWKGLRVDLESEQIFRQIRQWRDLGREVALATVVRTWGSSPRPAGSHLAVDSTGQFVGSVSGGCIEASVIDEAQSVIREGRPRRLQFGVSDEQAWEVGLACGGQVDVFVERIE
jgi:hypothetical protein